MFLLAFWAFLFCGSIAILMKSKDVLTTTIASFTLGYSFVSLIISVVGKI
jgi:hypothetical protein